jgi:DNA-binding XRE family transcriptional regulator
LPEAASHAVPRASGELKKQFTRGLDPRGIVKTGSRGLRPSFGANTKSRNSVRFSPQIRRNQPKPRHGDSRWVSGSGPILAAMKPPAFEAEAASPRLSPAKNDSATCDNCRAALDRRTSERLCENCLAPLRRLRRRAGLTQAELARRVGCRPHTIHELEHDRYHPALALAQAIAKELSVDVLETFPSLEITKVEAQKFLNKTWRSIDKLCESGELPCDSDGHWHRIPFRAVLEFRQELDEFRHDWISFNAAERESGLPRWILHRLSDEGAFGGDVKVVNGESGRPINYVRRSTLEAARQELLANYRRVRCPRCKLPMKLGRKSHARCLGWLAVRAYWKIGADAATRADVARKHGERVRNALRGLVKRRRGRSPERSKSEYVRWFVHRFGRKPSPTQLGRWLGFKGRGRPRTQISEAQLAQIKELEARGWGRRAIARQVALTEDVVRRVLREIRAA